MFFNQYSKERSAQKWRWTIPWKAVFSKICTEKPQNPQITKEKKILLTNANIFSKYTVYVNLSFFFCVNNLNIFYRKYFKLYFFIDILLYKHNKNKYHILNAVFCLISFLFHAIYETDYNLYQGRSLFVPIAIKTFTRVPS